MNIKSVKKANDVVGNFDHYILTNNNNKIFNVPLDEDNRHYQDIRKWVADGNTIQEAD